jgi:hypothetical protein
MSETKFTEDLPHNLKEYIRIQYEIHKLRLSEKIALGGAAVITATIISLVVLFTILFSSFAAGYYLSERLGSSTTGFLIISGIYAFVALLLIIFRKKLLTERIRDGIIRKLLN